MEFELSTLIGRQLIPTLSKRRDLESGQERETAYLGSTLSAFSAMPSGTASVFSSSILVSCAAGT